MRLRTRLALTLALTALPLSLGLVALHESVEARATQRSLAEFGRTRMESGGREICEANPQQFQEPPLFLTREGRGANRPENNPDGSRPPRVEDAPEGARARPEGPAGRPEGSDGARPARPDGAEGQPQRPARGEGPGRYRGRQFSLPPSDVRFELFAYRADFKSENARAPAFPAELQADLEQGEPFAGSPFDDGVQHGTLVGVRMPWVEGPAALVLVRRIESGPHENAWTLYGGALLLSLTILAVALVSMRPIVHRVRALTEGVRRSAEGGYAEGVADPGADEITELAEAFNAAGATVREKLSTLERREKTLRTFVENTTHDVMLPLTVLQGHLSAMDKRLEKGEDVPRERVRESLEEAHYLGSLVHNLTAAAKLEAGEPAFVRHPFSLNQLVERSIGRHATIARSKGIELVHAVPEAELFASGDVTLFEQALSNVVHNAIRYNKESGHVAVLLEERDGEFALRVVDDGPGASQEELARLAERSFRSEDARQRHPTGLGLGLSIAKDVSERHGFVFEIRRSDHGGLEVEFRGPRLLRS